MAEAVGANESQEVSSSEDDNYCGNRSLEEDARWSEKQSKKQEKQKALEAEQDLTKRYD
jgi:hypothetical protein